jgi:hypothetical protein
MASKGRNGDSMLVHMTPGEVRGLQALAMKHGGSLTVNPNTGLPEANFLKSLLPMLAGFALNAFVPGLGAAVGGAFGASAAVGTGIAVGGLTGLATGSLSKGLMAGLGAYGGAGLSEGLLGAGAASGAGQTIATEAATQAGLEGITLPADYASLAARTATPDQIAAARAAGMADPSKLLSTGATSAMADPMAFAKANFKPLAAAAAPIMADMMVPTTTQMAPVQSPGRIREKRWDGRQFVDVANTDAGVFNTSGRSFSDPYRGYNNGGIVALARGGDAALAAYQAGNYAEANRLLGEAGMSAQDVVSKYNLDTAQAADVARNLGYAGDMSGIQYGSGYVEPVAETVAYTSPVADRTVVNRAAIEPDYFEQQFAPDVFAPVDTSPVSTPTASAASYTPNRAAIEPEDTYVAPAGIEALAATLPTAAPVTPKVTDEQIQTWWSDPKNKKLEDFEIKQVMDANNVTPTQFANAIGANEVTAADIAARYEKAAEPAGIETLTAAMPPVTTPTQQPTGIETLTAPVTPTAPVAPTTPTYNKYTNEEIAKYLVTNPTVDIAKAIKETKADPAAVNAYIASIADPFRGSTDTTGGSGVLGIYNQMKAQGIDPNELYAAEIANDPKYAGYTQPMIQRSYDLSKGAYALTDQIAKDKIAADPKLGYDKQWVKYMEDNKYTVDEMAQAFGISKNEIRDRIQKVKAAEAVVTPPIVPPVVVPPINATQNTTTPVAKPTDLYTAPATSLPVGVSGNTGPSQIGGGTTINPNGTITTSPRIPGIPVGGFTGSQNLRDTYTKGGGSLGYTSPTFKSIEDFNAKYLNRMSGDSKAAYDYLTGKAGATYPTKSSVGQISRPYDEAVLGYPARGNLPYIYNKVTGKMDVNPDYVAPGRDDKGNVTYSMSLNDIKSSLKDTPLSGQALYDWAKSNNLSAQQIADATGRSLSSVYADFRAGSKAAANKATDAAKGSDTIQVTDSSGYNTETVTAVKQADGTYLGGNGKKYDASGKEIAASGGIMGYAMGGAAGYALGGLGTLGGYSDGGRLLRGPGDGVSDSIPATIGRKQQPARLADGEFVIPARIVSELGNGSTDAGAKKLYAMLDRVQRARGKTTGRNKVAANSRADKYLPA